MPYMQNLSSIRQLGAELWTDSHTKVSFAVPLYSSENEGHQTREQLEIF